ncbi:MAG: TonB-dependent receptor [Marinagarivorans sp.]|nr:TonB-dependent receptor [Marinagarivorans sp.]
MISTSKKKLLALTVSAIATAWAGMAAAEEAVIYVAGAAASDLSLKINDALYFFDKSSVVVMDLEPGKYTAHISVKDKSIGAVAFELLANNYAEIKIRIDSDNKIISRTSKYDPAADIATGQLIGRIFETGGEGELAGATVKVHGEKYETTTTSDGSYILSIPRGVYTIEVSHPNHIARVIEDVRIISEVTTEASLSLPVEQARVEPSSVMEEMIVMGVVGAMDQSSLAIERDASSVVEAISAEDFKKFGDSSASDALKRVTGVSVVGGQFAVVRGLAGRYISTTLNGGMLPSTDGIRRDVPLDLFPSSVLGGIEIGKTFTASLPADSTGGHVGMALKEVPKNLESKLSGSMEYNTAVTGKDVVTYFGGGRDWTGIDDGTRDMPSMLSDTTDNGLSAIPPVCVIGLSLAGCVDKSVIADLGKSLNNNWQATYKKAGPNTSLGYGLGNNFDVFNGEVGVYGSLDYKQKWSNRDKAVRTEQLSDGSGSYRDSKVTHYERSQYLVDLTAYLTTKYETDSGNSIKSQTLLLRKTSDTTRLDDQLDIEEGNERNISTRLDWVEREMLYQNLTGQHAINDSDAHQIDWMLAYAKTDRDAPDGRSYSYFNGLFSPSSSLRTYSALKETAKNIQLNYSYRGDGFAESEVAFKVGASAFDKSRDSFKSRFAYAASAGADLAQPINSLLSDSNFDNNYIRLNWQTLSNDWYLADENGSAIYLDNEWIFKDEWTVNVGVRNERFSQATKYPNPNSIANMASNSYSDLLPAINLSWRMDDTWIWRAAVTQTVSRPGLVEINSSSQTDPDTDQSIIGNPDLKQSEISNLDVKGEYYFGEEEKLSVGVFYKDIKNPIEKAISLGADVYDAYTFRNSNSAKLSGLEMEFEKNVYDGKSWQGKLMGNFSWVKSEVQLDKESANSEGRSSRELQREQSQYLANMQFNLESIDSGQSVTLLVNYFGDRIDVVDKKSTGDRMEEGRLKIDVVYQYEMENGLTVNGKILDILNQDVVYVTRGSVLVGEESYLPGTTVTVGVAYNFY